MYYAQINAYYDIISIFKYILLCRNILGKKPVYIFGIKRGKKIVLVVLHQLAFLQYYQVMMKLYYY